LWTGVRDVVSPSGFAARDMMFSSHANAAADPGDDVILEWAVAESRILITMDKDFGDLVFEGQKPHSGLVRLPDVPAERRIELMATLLHEHTTSLASAAVITVRGGRVRVSRQGSKA